MGEHPVGRPPTLLERLRVVCADALPDSRVIVHGSLALGDFTPGKSDLDLLVLSDASTEGLVDAVEAEWERHPVNLDFRVVSYGVAAAPSRSPRMRLYVGVHNGRWEVYQEADEPDLVVEFSLCRQLGHTDVIGPVPDAWVDEIGATALGRWKEIGYDPPHHELMALTACRIWRFREERLHCSKPAAAAWAREQGALVAYDFGTVMSLLERATA